MHDIDRMLELQLQGKHEEARAISDKLEALGPEKIPDTQGKLGNSEMWIRHSFNRGWFKLQEGDYQAGCQLLENGRYISVYGSGPLKTDAPIFNPQEHQIKDKSIIISLEGGYGDEIIHAKFATTYKRLGAKSVYLAADPSLHGLFSRIEGVDGVIQRNQAHLVPHDYWVPGFSSGWVAGHTTDTIPNQAFLQANPDSIKIWKELIKADEGQIKVGIRWAGNPKFEHQQFRRFPDSFMTNLAKYPELKVFSLQRDHNTITLPEGITDLQYFLISWEDTAAAIMNLDIVITSCTSIAHLAAALGKETWVMVPILPYHTWTFGCPDSDTSPFYNCVRLFRQRDSGKWNNTFQNMYQALEEKFNLNHIEMPDEDKVLKRINIGCGQNKFKGFNNVDINGSVNPDQLVDLNQFPWPYKDKEYDHIFAKDILEHLGEKPDDIIKVIKEMYRISDNGAIWEIQVPHWRCDVALDDPTHKRSITPGLFHLFNKRNIFDKIKTKGSESMLAFEEDVDIEVVDMQFDFLPHWKERLDKREISQEELNYALNTFNNVASSYRLLIQVHKPGRISKQEAEIEMARYNQEIEI
jgi:predicted SAM-dependent methyltransferase